MAGCVLLSHNETSTKGGAGGAIVGGLIGGPLGAVVGSSVSGRTTVSVDSAYGVRVRFRNPAVESISITKMTTESAVALFEALTSAIENTLAIGLQNIVPQPKTTEGNAENPSPSAIEKTETTVNAPSHDEKDKIGSIETGWNLSQEDAPDGKKKEKILPAWAIISLIACLIVVIVMVSVPTDRLFQKKQVTEEQTYTASPNSSSKTLEAQTQPTETVTVTDTASPTDTLQPADEEMQVILSAIGSFQAASMSLEFESDYSVNGKTLTVSVTLPYDYALIRKSLSYPGGLGKNILSELKESFEDISKTAWDEIVDLGYESACDYYLRVYSGDSQSVFSFHNGKEAYDFIDLYD